jgi:hypothetical protein
MNEQQLAAVKQALEALKMWITPNWAGTGVDKANAAHAALQSIIAQHALDKKAENAREIGLDYEPAVQEKCFLCGDRVASCASDACPKSAQPAVQEGRDWSLLEATQESLREHMAEIKRLKAAQPAPVQEPVATDWERIAKVQDAKLRTMCNEPGAFEKLCELLDKYEAMRPTPPAPQPVPVKTYHDGKPWPVAPKPWVGLSEEEVEAYDDWADFQVGCGRQTLFDMVRDIEAKLKEKNHV